ncbi:hypothetical protein F4808DRAFT_465458 [Astrocystis sublimbata]|nr:hypothetical protein F4808DRAFT_465458 [Astrocystis sublimbata]
MNNARIMWECGCTTLKSSGENITHHTDLNRLRDAEEGQLAECSTEPYSCPECFTRRVLPTWRNLREKVLRDVSQVGNLTEAIEAAKSAYDRYASKHKAAPTDSHCDPQIKRLMAVQKDMQLELDTVTMEEYMAGRFGIRPSNLQFYVDHFLSLSVATDEKPSSNPVIKKCMEQLDKEAGDSVIVLGAAQAREEWLQEELHDWVRLLTELLGPTSL